MIAHIHATLSLLKAHLDLLTTIESGVRYNSLIRLSLRALHPPATCCPVSPNSAKVNGGGDNFDFGKRELSALGEDLAVHGNETCSVIVETVTVTTLLVSIEVDTAKLDDWLASRIISKGQMTHLHGGFFDKLHTTVELSKLVVTTRGVGKDLNTVKAHKNVGSATQVSHNAHDLSRTLLTRQG